ncbi:MAG: DUF2283 domain-containing protein [Ignavibacteriae bacterium]|nr:DUF2283 domain-containing protein [Ignavibacteriota bacterium]
MPKIQYDPEVKILNIRLREDKSVDSEIKENVVLDYDAQGHIVNIEIMDINIEDIIRNVHELESA